MPDMIFEAFVGIASIMPYWRIAIINLYPGSVNGISANYSYAILIC